MKPYIVLGSLLLLIYTCAAALLYFNQRSLLFFPTHFFAETQLQPWEIRGQIIGYSREVNRPRAVWLMTCGNGGQADRRAYMLKRMSDQDSLYVLEYPGYGLREGKPTKESIDIAAAQAYSALRERFFGVPICVVGESMGSGPASFLTTLASAPDKVVLIVPFDSIAEVAASRWPFFPVRFMLKDNWDNIDLLRNYRGSVEIFAAISDKVIPFEHGKNLAAHLPNAKFHPILGGHDWTNTTSPVRLDP